MSLEECNKLSALIVKKISSWPPEQTTNSKLISNLSSNLSNFSTNLSNKLSQAKEQAANGSRSPQPPSVTIADKTSPSCAAFSLANGGEPTREVPCSDLLTSHWIKSPPRISFDEPALSPCTSTREGLSSIDTISSKLPGTLLNGSCNGGTSLAIGGGSDTPQNLLSPDGNNNINLKLDLDLIAKIERLNEQTVFLHRNAVLFDYTGKQVNGYFSMLRVVQRFFEYMLYQMEKRKRRFQEFYEISCLLSSILDSMEQYRNKYLELKQRHQLHAAGEDDELKFSPSGSCEISSNDSEDDEEVYDGDGEFDSISTDMVKLSSDLATSIESMQQACDDETGDVRKIFEIGSEIGPNVKHQDMISDYYNRFEVNNEAADHEYGKEIRKEEYEKNQPRYFKMFNFKISSPLSMTIEESSPKKSQPITQKYYKYFANFTKNLEENFSFTSKASSADTSSSLAITPQSPKASADAAPAVSPIPANQETDEMQIEETEEEKKVRNDKLDEYILSKFVDTNDREHLITPPMMHFYEGFTLTLNNEKELGLIYGRVGIFWYCKSAANIVSLVRNLIVILTSPPSKSIASLCNTDYCGRQFAHRQVNATLDSLVNGLASLEVKAYNKRYFKYLYRDYVIYGKTVHMPVYSQFVIPSYGNQLQRMPDEPIAESMNGAEAAAAQNGHSTDLASERTLFTIAESPKAINGFDEKLDVTQEDIKFTKANERTVRCRLIHYVRPAGEPELCVNYDRCLVFHIHGGGFVLSSPDSHELYLRDWAVKLKGIPILSVDYVLRKRYPSAPQDILDVYLTLVNPKNRQLMSELIGFQPEKIILVGDSAGANLMVSLLCALNEVRRNNPDFANLQMPIAALSIYGVFDIRAVMSPSKFLSSIDPILHHGNIMAMVGTYAGIASKIRKSLWSRIKNKKLSAWYRVSERELKSRFKHLSAAMESYFASPLVYPHFDDFKHISLYLVTTHLCPLVDDSVVMYKVWPGEVEFEAFDGLPHAFLNFFDRSEEAKQATHKCIEKIVQAFQKDSRKQQQQLQEQSSLSAFSV